jgi:hypothetical protein
LHHAPSPRRGILGSRMPRSIPRNIERQMNPTAFGIESRLFDERRAPSRT